MFRHRLPAHVCRMEPRAVSQNSTFATGTTLEGAKTAMPQSRSTKVLWACSGCHKREVQVLDGHWTLEEMRCSPVRKGFESPWLGYRTTETEN